MRKNFKKAERATAIPAKFGTASQARWIRRATLSGGTALAMLMGGMSANALWGDYYDTNTPMFAAGSVAFGVLPYYGLFHEKGESSRAIKVVYTDEPLAIVNNDLWNWSRSDGRWETRYTHGQLDTASWPISSPTTIDSPTPLSPVTSTNGSGITRTLVGNRGAALFNMSQSGAPVELRIPGAVIAQVMHQTEENPWVFWQFIVDGAAPESVGLMYDMSVLGQCAPDMSAADCHTQGSLKDPYGVWGTPTKPWDGAGSTDPESLFGYTLLGMSEVLIYPAAADRTCAVKNGDGPQNWPIVPEVRLEQLLSYIPDYLDKYAAYESAEAEWEALNDPDADTSDVDAAWDAAQVPFVEIFNLANKLGISYPDDFDLGDPLHPVYVGTRDFEASNVFVYTEALNTTITGTSTLMMPWVKGTGIVWRLMTPAWAGTNTSATPMTMTPAKIFTTLIMSLFGAITLPLRISGA